MRCYRITGGFRITGFAAVTAATSLTLYVHLKSLQPLTAQNVEVNIYGIYDDMTSPVVKKANVVTVTHVADSVPAVLTHINEVSIPMYSSIHYDNYYEFEGSLQLRNIDLLNGDFIEIQDPYGMDRSQRFLIRKKDNVEDGWTELAVTAISTDSRYRFTMPTNYLNTLTIAHSSEYIWRYTSIYAPQNTNTENGWIPNAFGSNQFYI